MKKNCKAIKILSALFSAFLINACASPEIRYIEKRCEITPPIRPHSADFESEFDFLKEIFFYTFELEKVASVCVK